MPTRIFRSETGFQTPLGRAEVATPASPRIFLSGVWAAAVVEQSAGGDRAERAKADIAQE